MIPLTSKSFSRIQFPGMPGTILHGPQTITVETGVAVFAFTGTNPHDWTRDTLSFPVGNNVPPGQNTSGIAAAGPTSFWAPLNTGSAAGGSISIPVSLNVFASDSSGDIVQGEASGSIVIPSSAVPPPIGWAVDSAVISHTPGQAQATITMALAVFGTVGALLRVSYTAYLVTGAPGLVVGGGGVANAARRKRQKKAPRAS